MVTLCVLNVRLVMVTLSECQASNGNAVLNVRLVTVTPVELNVSNGEFDTCWRIPAGLQ